MVKVSIIIPVYNLEDYLDRCLQSVLNQTLREIEVICINDASTDNSLNILNTYKESDERVVVLSIEKSGQGVGRNIGIQHATGEYVGFVDGDDSVDTEMFEQLCNAATEHNSEISFCHAACYDSKGKTVKYPYFDNEKSSFRSKQKVMRFSGKEILPHLSRMVVVPWNKIYRRTFLLENNVQFGEGTVHEDIPFYYRAMLNAGSVTVVRKSLYNYSANRPGSATNAVMSTSPRLMEVLAETQKLIADKLSDDDVAKQFYQFKVTQLIGFLNYAFHRHQNTKMIKFRFFLMVRAEIRYIETRHLKGLSFDERFQVWYIRRKYMFCLRLKLFSETMRFYLKNPDQFSKKIIPFVRLVYGHVKYYIDKLIGVAKR
jgi:glycosyltransferase involved in cell wall biosynthesis